MVLRPMTLGNGALPPAFGFSSAVYTAAIRSSPIPPRWAAQYGAETPVLDWRERLVCSKCGSRQVDVVRIPEPSAACDKRVFLT
jgi:hypothetical protein